MKFLYSATLMSLFTLALSKCNYVCPSTIKIAEEAVQAAAEKVDRNPKKKHDTIWKTENTLHITFDLENKIIVGTEYSISARIFTPDNTIRVFETETKTGKQRYCDKVVVNGEDELSYDESFEAELSDAESEDESLVDLSEEKPKTN